MDRILQYKKMRPTIAMLVAVMLAIVMIGSAAISGFAETEGPLIEIPKTTTINLHKVAYDEYPTGIQNDGTDLSATSFAGATYLAGAKFTAVDVSARYYYLQSGAGPHLSADAAYAALVSEYTPKEIGELDDQTTNILTYMGATPLGYTAISAESNASGNTHASPAVLNLSTYSSSAVYGPAVLAAYVLYETARPSGASVVTRTVPLVLVLPVANPAYPGSDDDPRYLSNVNVYPKNEVKDVIEKTLATTATNGVYIGETLDFVIDVNLPANFGETVSNGTAYKYGVIQITDTPDTGLTFGSFGDIYWGDSSSTSYTSAASLQSYLRTATADNTVTVTAASNVLTIDFKRTVVNPTKTAYLASLGGISISVTVTSTVNANAPIDTDFDNESTIKVGDGSNWDIDENGDSEDVQTHGYKFKKHDGGSLAILPGAVFNVRAKSPGTYSSYPQDANHNLYFVLDSSGTYGGEYRLATSTSEPNATINLTSATINGQIVIKGLQTGTSTDLILIERTAPTNYATLDSPINFMITATTYGDSDTAGDPTGEALDQDTFHNILDSKNGTLPTTGGSGIALLVILGAIVIGLAFVLAPKRKQAKIIE